MSPGDTYPTKEAVAIALTQHRRGQARNPTSAQGTAGRSEAADCRDTRKGRAVISRIETSRISRTNETMKITAAIFGTVYLLHLNARIGNLANTRGMALVAESAPDWDAGLL